METELLLVCEDMTFGNDSSDDIETPAFKGKIYVKTYSVVTNRLMNNPEVWKDMTKNKRLKLIRGESKTCSIQVVTEPIWYILHYMCVMFPMT